MLPSPLNPLHAGVQPKKSPSGEVSGELLCTPEAGRQGCGGAENPHEKPLPKNPF